MSFNPRPTHGRPIVANISPDLALADFIHGPRQYQKMGEADARDAFRKLLDPWERRAASIVAWQMIHGLDGIYSPGWVEIAGLRPV